MKISEISANNFSILNVPKTTIKRADSQPSFKRLFQEPSRFKNRDEALLNYKDVAQSVNRLISEDKKSDALAILGYIPESYTGVMKLFVGDEFVPYFSYFNEESKKPDYITYKEAGINISKLKYGVAYYKGEEYNPNESISENFEFVPSKKYYLPTFYKLDELLTKKSILVNEALSKNEDEKALNLLGFKTTSDEKGNITIKGDYSNVILRSKDTVFASESKTLGDYGIDENQLLRNVTEIEGTMNLQDSELKSLRGDIKIGKEIILGDCWSGGPEEFFKNFDKIEDLSRQYENLDAQTIEYLYKNGFISDITVKEQYGRFSIRTYPVFRKGNEDVHKTLSEISSRRDKILSVDELREKYLISKNALINMFKNSRLVPFIAFSEYDKSYSAGSKYLYDIENETNKAVLEEHRQTMLIKGAEEFSKSELENACQKNSVSKNYKEEWIHDYRASVLEELGYGSKEDLIAQCKLSAGLYKFYEYIMSKDRYDISSDQMMTIVDCARNNNPAMIKTGDLQKRLKGHYSEFIQAIIEDRINVITEDALRLTSPFFGKYYINLMDEKNLKFFRSIDDEKFQNWLSSRETAYKEYKTDNIERVKKLKAMSKLSEADRKQALNDLVEFEKKRMEEKKERLRKEKAMNVSLRATLAWVFAPRTRTAWRNRFSPEIKEIFERTKEAKNLNQQLLKGEITAEELDEELKKLTVTKEDKIKLEQFYAGVWADANGSGEFKQGQVEAKRIIEIYKKQGLDGIQDEKIREKIIKWEEKWKEANKKSD